MRARISLPRILRLLPAVVLLPLLSTGQQSSQPSYSVRVKVVNVPATVHDKHGQIVRNLTKDDFILQEDGRPQEIRYFSQESNLPLTLGLLVDTSLSQRRVLEDERRASYTFLDRILREDKDKAFLIHFDRDTELLQDLTASRRKLQEALDDLHTPDTRERSDPNSGGGQSGGSYPGGGYPGGGYPGSGPWGGGGPWGRRGGGGYPGGNGGHRGGGQSGYGGPGTVLYDAVFLGSDELMSKQQGRKAIIILSDGVDTGSKLSLERAVEASQRADTIVYSILFSDESAYGGMFGGFGHHGGGSPAEGKRVLERISKETGGRIFEVSKKDTIEKIYSQIEEELRNQYSLGYTPDRADLAPGYHKIEVKAKAKDYVVQSRSGYYFEPGRSQRAQK